jgi:hypothetical protein
MHRLFLDVVSDALSSIEKSATNDNKSELSAQSLVTHRAGFYAESRSSLPLVIKMRERCRRRGPRRIAVRTEFLFA